MTYSSSFNSFTNKISLIQTQNSDSVIDGQIRSVDPIVREWTSCLTIMMANRACVVWHIYSKERNLHFTIVTKTDPLMLLCFRLSFVVYFALLTIYLTTVPQRCCGGRDFSEREIWINGLCERERFVHLKDLFKNNDSFTNVTSLEPRHETETQDMSAGIRTPRSNTKQSTQTRERTARAHSKPCTHIKTGHDGSVRALSQNLWMTPYRSDRTLTEAQAPNTLSAAVRCILQCPITACPMYKEDGASQIYDFQIM